MSFDTDHKKYSVIPTLRALNSNQGNKSNKSEITGKNKNLEIDKKSQNMIFEAIKILENEKNLKENKLPKISFCTVVAIQRKNKCSLLHVFPLKPRIPNDNKKIKIDELCDGKPIKHMSNKKIQTVLHKSLYDHYNDGVPSHLQLVYKVLNKKVTYNYAAHYIGMTISIERIKDQIQITVDGKSSSINRASRRASNHDKSKIFYNNCALEDVKVVTECIKKNIC